VTAGPPGDQPIEVHLSDGGRIVVSFVDVLARNQASDQLIATILRVDGSEHDIEQAIEDDIRALGLTCTCSTSRGPTEIVIG
jgi:hypothetical protein